jgi:hypothetical protein
MPKQVKPVIMFLVLDYVYMKMKSNLERKILLIDEAWSLLSRTEDATYIFEIVKTCRKFNLGLLLINQEAEGLLNSEAGKSVLANSAYTLLMRQKPAVIKSVCETFHLSNPERTHLLTANVGEGILIMEDDHTEIKIIASPEEHAIITTNADELLKNTSKKQKQCTTKDKASKSSQSAKPKKPVKSKEDAKPKVSINVDAEKRFYRHKDLNLDEIKYLLTKKYKEIERKSIVFDKVEKFLIKPRFNESEEHMFLTFEVARFLEANDVASKMPTTKRADVIFELAGKKFAAEIETGTNYEKARAALNEKVKELKKNYDHWFFVISNKRYLKKYRQLGETVDKRYLANYLKRLLKNHKTSPAEKQLQTVNSRRKKQQKKTD